MTLFVDDARTPGHIGRVDGVWSHLFSDDPDDGELRDFAVGLELPDEWYQPCPTTHRRPLAMPHYDVTETSRADAVRAGAIPVPTGALLPILHRRHELAAARAQLREVYRDRAHLIAWATTHPDVTDAALYTDPTATLAECATVAVLHTHRGQLTWHLHDHDLPRLAHLDRLEPHDPRARWDHHTTTVKQQRITALITDHREAL